MLTPADRPALDFRPTAGHLDVQETATGPGAITWAITANGPSPAGGWDPDLGVLTLPRLRRLAGFGSSWGLEFGPLDLPVDRPAEVGVASGRSSNQAMPWLFAESEAGWVAVTVHWSGNWRFRAEPGPEGTHRVDIGLRTEGQRILLDDGERLALPAVSVGWGEDRMAAAAALTAHLAGPAPRAPLLTEWNHWWPYEDVRISEDVFLANVDVAADLGLEVAVLDAGWFGRSDAGSSWVGQRGDWHLTNTERFPHGLAWLAEQTRARGLGFGIWVEAEAIGPEATIAEQHPELVARDRDGRPLGYVCLGSPAGRDHVLAAVQRLITATRARWVKWDFNLDPGDGCARDDHGHDQNDGLLRHYRGLYAVLDRLRSDNPDLIVEACSSGGLRIDAGLAAHVHAFFLSDPDWTEHHLACLWGAAQQLPARQLLHWPQSEWRGEHRFQKVDYSGTLITTDQFDTKIRAALLHRFGVSVRLTELRPDLRDRLRGHLRTYREVVRPLLTDGVLVPLTDQPLREEQGWRQPAFQLSSGEDRLLAAFRLPPDEAWSPVRPRDLDPGATYKVQLLRPDGADAPLLRSGRELVEAGLEPPATATSALWSIGRPVP